MKLRLHLREQPGGGLKQNTVRSRLSRFLRGEWRYLIEEAWHDANLPSAAARAAAAASSASAESIEARLMRQGRRAADLASNGEYSRAAAILASNDTVAPITDSTIAKLRELHPDEPGFEGTEFDDDFIAEVRAATADRPVTITPKDVAWAVANASVKSAGGPSGLTAAHIRDPVLQNEELRTLMARVFTRIVNGAGDAAELGQVIGLCRLLPLLKPNGGIRPIAIGEILRRLCGRILLRKHASAARATFEPLQVGVGTRNGGIAIVHSTTALLAAKPRLVLLNIDLKNAFNRMSRVAIFRRLLQTGSRLRDIVQFVRLFYTEPGKMFVKTGGADPHVVESKTGSQQGCTFGSLLWSAGWQDALEAFAERTDYTVSYIDDGTFALEPAGAAAFLEFVAEAAAKHGGELNMSKCVAYSPENVLPADLRALGVLCVDSTTPASERGIIMQGVPVGSPEFTARWLNTKLAEQQELMRRLTAYVPDRLAACQILSWCVVPPICVRLGLS